MEYTTIVSELENLLECMEMCETSNSLDDWWVYESERKALVHAIGIINDLIDGRLAYES